MVDKEAETILEKVLKDTAPTGVANPKWEYSIGKNKMDELRNDTAEFSYAMKHNDSVERKIQTWCEGKEATVVKDKNDNNRKILKITDAVNSDILDEYHQIVIGEIYWRFAMRVFGSDHTGQQTYITLR